MGTCRQEIDHKNEGRDHTATIISSININFNNELLKAP